MIWYLILLAVVVLILTLVGSCFFLHQFLHPEDAPLKKAWSCKILVVLGLSLSCIQTLLIPFDLAFRGEEYNPVPTMWEIAYIGTAVYCFGVVPFFSYFYETNEFSKPLKRLCHALCWSILSAAFFCIVCGICYAFLATVEIPLESHITTLFSPKQLKCLMANNRASGVDCAAVCPGGNCILHLPKVYFVFDHIVSIRTTLLVYVLALVAFIGSFLVMLYAGIGLFGLPLSRINEYRHRPHRISDDEFAKKKLEMADDLRKMVDDAKSFIKKCKDKGKSPNMPSFQRFVNKFQAMLHEFQGEYDVLVEVQDKHAAEGIKALMPYISLASGVVYLAIAISWFIHILVYMFLRDSFKQQFLNSIFTSLNDAFPLCGVLAYMTFAIYLFAATIKGQMIFGMRFFLIKIHPLEAKNTLMNSMLFNSGVILLCSSACCRFCADAFAGYVAGTSTANLFGTQVKYLRFFKYFYQYLVFYYVFFGMSTITLLIMVIWPYFKKKPSKELDHIVQDAKKQKKKQSAKFWKR